MLSAEKLKFLRQLHNITQLELGKEMDISKNYISMVENRKTNYTEEWCDKCVKAIYTLASQKKNQNNLDDVEDIKKEVKKVKNKK